MIDETRTCAAGDKTTKATQFELSDTARVLT